MPEASSRSETRISLSLQAAVGGPVTNGGEVHRAPCCPRSAGSDRIGSGRRRSTAGAANPSNIESRFSRRTNGSYKCAKTSVATHTGWRCFQRRSPSSRQSSSVAAELRMARSPPPPTRSWSTATRNPNRRTGRPGAPTVGAGARSRINPTKSASRIFLWSPSTPHPNSPVVTTTPMRARRAARSSIWSAGGG